MTDVYQGAYTAIVTPFTGTGSGVDFEGLRLLTEFQAEQDVAGVVSVGTTGESPTLTWTEHHKAFETTFDSVGSKLMVVASTGSNSTAECLEGTKFASELGIRDVLLVDPYYNGPSSLEIRREYLEPLAATFPEIGIIPYIIPGRCGTQLLPQDLSIACERYRNIRAVKEATGDFDNMKTIRKLCGNSLSILSGDDDKTLQMLLDPEIKSSGVISVISNVAPKSVKEMCRYALNGDVERARSIAEALQPLFDIVTVKTTEETDRGSVAFKARNPLPIKTLMGILGLPVGPVRPPLGKMTSKALSLLLDHARKVQQEHAEVFEPLSSFFDVDVEERLTNDRYLEGWHYDGY